MSSNSSAAKKKEKKIERITWKQRKKMNRRCKSWAVSKF
jgi:hypothetical protein